MSDALFRKLYPEMTGDTGPLVTWIILLIVIVFIVVLFYVYQRYLQIRFLTTGEKSDPYMKNN